eukprot:CAMPEP_0197631070 /NCGR_PEP_ID=MMETSP1338-20131121/8363_1 /TAXON_ID=43686 ORGANISM="Pelagodinium beii, Strain RCC1491" /NCGR_SAMPLE_ID=MMETSP1338 /ASSEMBLY_ACC=CAM_ASM_000754 /LENGTH=32 /DNA_ID= /DNA_START= /DNA_END= /DNA_ORIENTATION=
MNIQLGDGNAHDGEVVLLKVTQELPVCLVQTS